MKRERIRDKLSNILFPPDVSCIVCGAELKYDEEREFSVCGACQKEFDYIGDREQKISNPRLNISDFASVFKYEGAAKKLTLSFKDGDRPYLRENIATYLYKIYKEREMDCHIICYVPSSKQKLKIRGYDPMKLVAEYMSVLCGKETKHLLARKEQLIDQTESTDRYQNISGCFYYNSSYNPAGKKILLLDDVVTTGATASECARVLLLKGVQEVNLLTFTEAKSFEDYKHRTVQRMNNA